MREAHENRLSPLLIRLNVCSSWIRRRLGDGWVPILISGGGLSYACSPAPDHGRAALVGERPSHWVGRSPPVDRFRVPATKFVPPGRYAKGPGLRQHTGSQVRYRIVGPTGVPRTVPATTGVPHIVPGSSATQWYWGFKYDISTAKPDF